MVLTKKLCWCLIVLAQACLLTGVHPSAVFASNPEVVTIMPPGVQRGKTTEVTIGGARLADAKQLLFFTPGVVVESIKAVDEANVKAMISVPADCACDLHAFRLVTETGISNLRYLGIGTMPIVDEVEPNSDFAKPQLIESNVTIHGIIKAEDVDYFAIDLKKGEPLTIEIEGLRLSYLNNFFDPFVAVLDSRRFELARSDDFPLVYQDGICSFEAPEDGRYTIEIRESSYGGSDRSVYRAHIGRFPRPVAIHPAGGSPGETLQVTCVDGKGTVWKESITIPTEVDKEFKFWSQRDGLVSPSPNFLRVRPYANVQESPENDDPNKVSVSETLPAAFHGILEKKDDQDWFGFQAKKDQTLDIKVFARGTLRSPVDSLLTIRKIGGGQVGANDDSGGPDSYVSFKVPEDGKYAVGIRDHLEKGVLNIFIVSRLPLRKHPLPQRSTNSSDMSRKSSMCPQGRGWP